MRTVVQETLRIVSILSARLLLPLLSSESDIHGCAQGSTPCHRRFRDRASRGTANRREYVRQYPQAVSVPHEGFPAPMSGSDSASAWAGGESQTLPRVPHAPTTSWLTRRWMNLPCFNPSRGISRAPFTVLSAHTAPPSLLRGKC
jgi:hypothetical protein